MASVVRGDYYLNFFPHLDQGSAKKKRNERIISFLMPFQKNLEASVLIIRPSVYDFYNMPFIFAIERGNKATFYNSCMALGTCCTTPQHKFFVFP